MLSPSGRGQRGYTIVELLVSLAITAVILGVVGGLGFRQQRFHRDIVVVAERLEQLDQAAALVPIALRSIAPGEGDIPPGMARDTSLEFRATIATGVLCDSINDSIVLAPASSGPPHLGSLLTRPEPGDTAWTLVLSGEIEQWVPRSITAVSDSLVACTIGGASPWPGGPRVGLALRVLGPTLSGRTVIRITRRWRYSLYRASAGGWFLGAKDWDPATLRFNTIQPVSGPFLSAASKGLVFRYADSVGATVASGAVDPSGIALIEMAFRVDSLPARSAAPEAGLERAASTAVSLRNRAR